MTPEGAVLKAVCDLLAAERIPFWRMNTGAVKTENRFFRFGQKGMADVLAMPHKELDIKFGDGTGMRFPGSQMQMPLWIECKSATGRQSEDQKEFENYVRDNGMRYIVARSSDDVLQWLRDNGVKR